MYVVNSQPKPELMTKCLVKKKWILDTGYTVLCILVGKGYFGLETRIITKILLTNMQKAVYPEST